MIYSKGYKGYQSYAVLRKYLGNNLCFEGVS